MKKRLVVGTALVVAALAATLYVYFNRLPGTASIEVKALTLGTSTQPTSALVHVAAGKGMFAAAGLDVTVKTYPSGKRALLDGLLPGQVDVVTAADIPFVATTFTQPGLKVLASIATADNVNRIVGRQSLGILALGDLRGMTIGTQGRSAVHYFLHSVLTDQQLHEAGVNLKFYKAEMLTEKLVAGDIDAFSMREPYVSQAQAALAEDAVVLAAPGVFEQNELVLFNDSAAANDAEIQRRLLRALTAAAKFASEHPGDAINLAAKATGSNPAKLGQIWPTVVFEVSMDQSMLTTFESIARWLLDENLVDPAPPPKFLSRMEDAALRSVSPDAVSLIQ